ncbi:CDP-glycerol glycerophosphotransferase family protein [Streptomyces sp. NPDC006971]|uniref:CDP-glycerol glycerophosphotransferase family protein n=1 Tax=Streptomyces sp. NPDC006971 TaxID=3154784 RepID=UPI0033F00FE5
MDGPIVCHAPDWAACRAARGACFDLLSGRPGETPGTVTTSGGRAAGGPQDRRAALGPLDAAAGGVPGAFCAYDDGHAAERVVRRFFLGEGGDGV